MSADGKQLVAIVAAPGSDYRDTALATWDLDKLDEAPVVTPSGDRMKFIGAFALKAGRTLVFARQEWTGQLADCGEGRFAGATATFVFKSYLTDAKHSAFSEAFSRSSNLPGVSDEVERCLDLVGRASLVDTLALDPTKVLIRRVNGLVLEADYFLYDLESGRMKLLLRAGKRATPGLFHPRDGKLLTRNDIEGKGSDEYEQRVLIRNGETGKFEVHDKLTTLLTERYTISIVGIDDHTGKYYVLTDLFSNYVQAWMYDPKERKFDDEALVAHGEFSIDGLVFGNQKSNFNKLLGFRVGGSSYETTFVDAEMRSVHEGLKQAFKGQTVTITDYNDGLSRILFMTESSNHPPAYHLLIDRQRVTTLGSQRSWLKNQDISKQRWVSYTARDGLEIPAILDLPAGWSKEDGLLPAVINPHGGPWARDAMGWDISGWVPFLTSRGYAVLRPQYRGSSGLGRKLWLAGDAEWGKAMQDDLDDGAKWLVEQGIADTRQLVIFGYSYGGFASAAATVRPDSPFRCAIAGAPVTDLKRLGVTWSENRLQRLLQGKTVDGMNPMDNTDKAHVPILLYVGDRDVRTPSWHAKNFYKDVKDHVPAQFELIEDMPHQLPWYYRHHEQTLQMIENYLEKGCGLDGT
jgi:dipeptidyl aminopeptidase/acylaminoacyl peptidase